MQNKDGCNSINFSFATRCEKMLYDNVPNTVGSILANKQVNQPMFPNMTRMPTIAATLAVTSCSCERSFSSLRRLKTFNRMTMADERMTGLAMLHVHREIHEGLDKAVEEFANPICKTIKAAAISSISPSPLDIGECEKTLNLSCQNWVAFIFSTVRDSHCP